MPQPYVDALSGALRVPREGTRASFVDADSRRLDARFAVSQHVSQGGRESGDVEIRDICAEPGFEQRFEGVQAIIALGFVGVMAGQAFGDAHKSETKGRALKAKG